MLVYFSLFFGYLAFYIFILIAMAFFTLFEQKVLGSLQIRHGPAYAGPWGLLQPFADAVKLFGKGLILPGRSNLNMYQMSPILSLSLSIFLWSVVPLGAGGVDFSWGIFFFFIIMGLGVYPVYTSGWGSNCKYSMLGSLRSVAQMISYDISLGVMLVVFVWLNEGFSVEMLKGGFWYGWGIFLYFPLVLVWFLCMLAETHRTPYDFSEGESELVSGFNTEYGSGGFMLIFMSEYMSLLFSCIFFSFLFLGGESLDLGFKSLIVGFVFIWVRGTLPRARYDKLMYLAWKSFLPVSLFMLGFYFWVGFCFVCLIMC